MNNIYRFWSEIVFGLVQRFIFNPVLFNTFLCELYIYVSNIDSANYADGNTLYFTNKHLEIVLNDLEQASDVLWFSDNFLEANVVKYHLLVSTNGEQHLNKRMG